MLCTSPSFVPNLSSAFGWASTAGNQLRMSLFLASKRGISEIFVTAILDLVYQQLNYINRNYFQPRRVAV